ncbi:MAG: sulfurtransferase-like selenium metabolism protein YedF [Desulfobacterales bacterium]|nr:sulfurtransferase-like selenium metabolism protein YedF [Desulfobacterales bacterium]MBS3755451.1 sulfurtransferase-like selenium metabolism protein YedF [Desulfobacterales bacterium]
MKEIDARQRACPTPVIMTKETIEAEAPEAIRVRVDNEAASQNVSRFFKSRAYEAKVETAADGFEVIGTRGDTESRPDSQAGAAGSEKKIMVMITTDRMGSGDDTLGAKLMRNFVHTLGEMGPDLWRLVLVNSGVRLAVEGADVLPDLRDLESEGLQILVCGTCLDHYGLLDQKRVGDTTNMLDIVTAMQLSDQVINI